MQTVNVCKTLNVQKTLKKVKMVNFPKKPQMYRGHHQWTVKVSMTYACTNSTWIHHQSSEQLESTKSSKQTPLLKSLSSKTLWTHMICRSAQPGSSFSSVQTLKSRDFRLTHTLSCTNCTKVAFSSKTRSTRQITGGVFSKLLWSSALLLKQAHSSLYIWKIAKFQTRH